MTSCRVVTEQDPLGKAQERAGAWALAGKAGASEPAEAEVEVREGAEAKAAVALTATVAVGKALRTKRRTSDTDQPYELGKGGRRCLVETEVARWAWGR